MRLLASFPGRYDASWLSRDALAGLTVWAVLVPESLAYASIAGVSPVVGLYAAPAALIFYAAFGSSRHLIVGPMSATAALSAATIADLVTNDASRYTELTATLAITVGVVALVAGLLRFGFIANFISEPVLKGFIIGLALTILVGQLPKLFGVEGGDGNFFEKLWDFLKELGDTQWRTLTVGLISLAIVLVLRAVAPRIPASLVAVLFGIVVVNLFDLGDKGVAIVGHIDSGLPSLGLPKDVQGSDYFTLISASFGVALVGFAEGLGAAKTYATKEHYSIDANRELIGLGASNVGAGLSSGMVVNGSLSKTAVNGGAGAKTQISGLVAATLTIVTLLFLTGLFEDLPEATLAAVVIAAVIELVDVKALIVLFRTSTTGLGRIYGVAARPDFIAATAAMLGVLIFDTLPGLVIGVLVSVLLLLYRTSRPNVAVLGELPGSSSFADIARNAEAHQVPGVLIVRPESSLLFVNADHVRDSIMKAITTDTRAVILDAETVPSIDITAASTLTELASDLGERGIRFLLARDVGQLRDLLRADAAQRGVEPPKLYRTVRDALADVGMSE